MRKVILTLGFVGSLMAGFVVSPTGGIARASDVSLQDPEPIPIPTTWDCKTEDCLDSDHKVVEIRTCQAGIMRACSYTISTDCAYTCNAHT